MVKSIFLNVLRYGVLLLLVIFISTKLSWSTWTIYNAIFAEKGGAWIDLRSAVGFTLNYIFLVPLLFSLLGDRFRYWIIAILFIPFLLLEFSGDFSYAKQDFLIAIIGLGIGWSLRYGLYKLPQFEKYKKYF